MRTATGALAQGGVIILDDCFNEQFPGVCDGVFKFFADPQPIAPFGMGANKTFFCHKEFADRYAKVLRSIDDDYAERSFLNCPVVYKSFWRPPLAVRIGRNRVWQMVRNLPGMKLARSLYKSVLHFLPE